MINNFTIITLRETTSFTIEKRPTANGSRNITRVRVCSLLATSTKRFSCCCSSAKRLPSVTLCWVSRRNFARCGRRRCAMQRPFTTCWPWAASSTIRLPCSASLWRERWNSPSRTRTSGRSLPIRSSLAASTAKRFWCWR